MYHTKLTSVTQTLLLYTQVHEQNNKLKTEIGQLKSSKRQLSSEFERLKEKYQILTQEFEKSTFINEAEVIMGRLEETLAEVESNLNNLPFVKPHKKVHILLVFSDVHDTHVIYLRVPTPYSVG